MPHTLGDRVRAGRLTALKLANDRWSVFVGGAQTPRVLTERELKQEFPTLAEKIRK